ncbi:hypothetical protein THRCLA_10630 [Thraustotheca clavata]|uniref:Uncharacterized protein n=1 Tax=Thraustotheca clavata TaxID=74557 RepID=A0A1V9YJH2_9STRA|nr:hypothetical protein THRCLA_10630 [Thraustotheca clavata]
MDAPDNIRSLILEKEKELHDINEYRIRTLESMLRDKEQSMNMYKQKFYKLQEDFKYNLKLLEGRDEELALYDSNFSTIKIVLRDRETEMSELKIQLAEVLADLKQEKLKHDEADVFYQQKLKDVKTQVEAARWSYEDATRRLKEELDSYKRKAERELREKDQDMETLKREMTMTLDELLRNREIECKSTMDDMAAKLREMELKSKSITREMDTTKERNGELRKKMDELLHQLQESETQNKSIHWELSDVRAMKDAKIQELEGEKIELQQVKQALLDEYEGKMAELLQSLHAVEKAFLQQKLQFDEEVKRVQQRKDQEMKDHASKFESRIEALVAKLRSVEDALEKVQTELKQSKWEVEDQQLQREREIERLMSDHRDALEQRESIIKDLKNQVWTNQVELKSSKDASRQSLQLIQDAKERETELKHQISQLEEKVEAQNRRFLTLDAAHDTKLQEKEQECLLRFETKYRELSQLKDRLQSEKNNLEERNRHLDNELLKLRGELYAQKSALQMNEAFKIPSPFIKTVSEPALSPSWSDNAGVTPIAQDLSSIPPVSPPGTIPDTPIKPESSPKLDALQAENAKLKNMIRTMTEELLKQTASPTDSPGSNEQSHLLQLKIIELGKLHADNILAIQSQLVEAQQALQGRIAQVNNLQSQLALTQQELSIAQQSIDQKTKLIDSLQSQLAGVSESQSNTVLSGQQLQLTQALKDIEILRSERNQLMELSNQLTSELRKQQTAPNDTRIADLSQSLEEYRLHNKALKKELRRWLKKEELSFVDSPTRRSRNTTASSLSSSQQTIRHAEPARRVDHLEVEESNDVLHPLPQSRRPSPFTISQLEDESHLRQAIESKPSIVSTLFQTKEKETTTLSDARQKLKQAKEVLALAGKKVDDKSKSKVSSTVPTTSSQKYVFKIFKGLILNLLRETTSQKNAMSKLKELQSKRAEMAEERKKVRNYSIPNL